MSKQDSRSIAWTPRPTPAPLMSSLCRAVVRLSDRSLGWAGVPRPVGEPARSTKQPPSGAAPSLNRVLGPGSAHRDGSDSTRLLGWGICGRMDDEHISDEQAADDARWMEQLRASLSPDERADLRDLLIERVGMLRYLEVRRNTRSAPP
ncbi:hypothetical protein GCM10009800_29490 [Nocardiopsis rhodophaea]